MPSHNRRHPRARGAALLEFAVVCPLLMTILFGIMEYGYVFLVQQSLTNAAREGCRIAVLQSSTDTQIDARIGLIMDAADITGYTTTKTHATTDPYDPVETVTVSVPYDSVSITGFFGTKGFDLEGHCTMRKEGM
ncbi:MAG: pilus assembly protein [bacterium]|nr:pilus assembly protein [bacterium]